MRSCGAASEFGQQRSQDFLNLLPSITTAEQVAASNTPPAQRRRRADMRWFADKGWLTISVDYTLSTEDRHLRDVTRGQI